MTFAKRLEQARQSAGLTQQAVADLVGVTRQTVNGWIHGGTPPIPFFQKAVLDAIAGAATEGDGKIVGKVRAEQTLGGWRLVDGRGFPVEPPVITVSAPVYPTKAAAQEAARSRNAGE